MTNDPAWDLIAAWRAVHRAGSLSGAARALGLSQPTVRRQIEALEARLGTPLFTRDTQGLTPLAGADDLAALAATIDAAARAFLRAAQGARDRVEGTVRLSCPALIGVEILPAALARLARAHPGLTVELALTNRVEDILRHEADVAVRLGPPGQDRIVARKVAAVEVGLFAAPGLAAADIAYATLQATVPFVGDDRRDLIAQGFAALGLPHPARTVLRTDDDLAQLAAIRAGVGAGVCQTRVAAGLLRLCPAIALRREAWVVTHEDLRHLPRIRAVIDALAAALA